MGDLEMRQASAQLYAGTGAVLTRGQTDIFQCAVVCLCCWNGHSQWPADMQLHQVKIHRRRDGISTVARSGVASVDVAAEGAVVLLDGHLCDLSPCRILRYSFGVMGGSCRQGSE